MAILAPNLATLRAEMNARWPRRDKASDGWIGDPAHQQRPSGHNPDESGNAERQDSDRVDEVRGLDLDKDIDPAPADELYAELDRIRRTPALRRRLIYIIYRRKIASSSNGWVWKDYSGDNPHTEHGHLSGHPDYDNDTTPWGVAKGDDMSDKAEQQIAELHAWMKSTGWADSVRALATLAGTPAVYTLPGGKQRTEPNRIAEALSRVEKQLTAVLTATGADADAVLAEIRRVAAAEAERDAQAAAEMADLAELVRRAGTGELSAEEVVDELSRRLAGEMAT